MSLSYQQVVVSNTVKTVANLTIPLGTISAEFQVDTNDVRYTLDGTVPSATLGMIFLKGETPKEIPLAEINRIKFIRGTSSDANLNIQYFGDYNIAEIDDISSNSSSSSRSSQSCSSSSSSDSLSMSSNSSSKSSNSSSSSSNSAIEISDNSASSNSN
jgi:hypothetical protein